MLIVFDGDSVCVFYMVALLLLGLCVQPNVSCVRSVLSAGKVLTGFVHVVEAVLEVIFEVCCGGAGDCHVVVRRYFLAC